MTKETLLAMSGADILVRSLKDLGVRQVFGYTGAAILPVMDELARQAVRIVVSANEQAAAFAAAGFSRAGGGVGVDAAGSSLPAAWPELPVARASRTPCTEPATLDAQHSGGHGAAWPEYPFEKKVKLQFKAAVKGGCG